MDTNYLFRVETKNHWAKKAWVTVPVLMVFDVVKEGPKTFTIKGRGEFSFEHRILKDDTSYSATVQEAWQKYIAHLTQTILTMGKQLKDYAVALEYAEQQEQAAR